MSNNQWNGAQDWNAQPQHNNPQEWGAQPAQDWNAQQPQQHDWGQSSQDWSAQPAQQQDWSAQPATHQPTSDDWTTISAGQSQQSASQAASPQSASSEWSLDQSVPATEQTTWTGAPPAAAAPEQPAQAWGQPAQQQDWNAQQAPQQQWGQQAAYGAPQQQWGGQPAQAQPNLFSALFDFKFSQKVAKAAPGVAYMIILIVLAVEALFRIIGVFSPYATGTSIVSGLFVALAQFVLWAIVWRVVIEGVVALVKIADKDDQS
ncbi:DUF4282 domain-containing protein [Arachnia propionica]|uniref:DUF4282 domain-containing protein n=1 Tax=Arachnia propionica TaxID=1750 RepID=A0A3P1T6V1_9ACTN|nr:DUF4282 domain-containing protein [Arachnia propionica]MDO5084351.1 DUF4282 domain-containing protein [Arachnia propionica]RRD05247.1 DUF4282 domain-containing protein [Arachnia propionica]